jgi:hypothetical protein
MNPGSHQFDPDNIERNAGSQYVNKRDVRNGLIGFLFVGGIFFVMYLFYKQDTDSSVCLKNLRAISSAMNEYAVENNERFPPAFDRDENGQPRLNNGKPVTWASVIRGHIPPRFDMHCPAADKTEVCPVAHPDSSDQSIALTYGMFLPIETRSLSECANPSGTIMVAESINGGAQNSFNPKPFEAGKDGFLISFDTGNNKLGSTIKDASMVTRLAFYNSKDALSGDDSVKATGRHQKGIHVLYLSGRVGLIGPSSSRLRRDLAGDIGEPWSIPDHAVEK